MSDLFLAKLAIYEALPAHLPDISHFQTIFQQTAHSCSFSPGAFHDIFKQTKTRTWLSLASYAEPFHHALQLFGEAFLDAQYRYNDLLTRLAFSLQYVFLFLHHQYGSNISTLHNAINFQRCVNLSCNALIMHSYTIPYARPSQRTFIGQASVPMTPQPIIQGHTAIGPGHSGFHTQTLPTFHLQWHPWNLCQHFKLIFCQLPCTKLLSNLTASILLVYRWHCCKSLSIDARGAFK